MKFGENFNPQAGLEAEENNEEVSMEELEAANEQLVGGFELSGDPQELMKNYEALFEGIETKELEFFKDVIDNAPIEVREALEGGDTGPLVKYADKMGVIGKRLVGLVVFAAISFAAMSFNVSSASAAGGGIEKAKMFSAGSDQAMMERVSIGGGGSKPLVGGGKIVVDAKTQSQIDFENKVAEYNKIKNVGNGVDGSGNENYVGGTYADGERVN
ncbi:MAG TPA: hypothetical protein DDY52_00930 [Candidatus Moranbacteria bacterium]|nr:hypothetical protein [Candidatus Moranbacteria bacterium]